MIKRALQAAALSAAALLVGLTLATPAQAGQACDRHHRSDCHTGQPTPSTTGTPTASPEPSDSPSDQPSETPEPSQEPSEQPTDPGTPDPQVPDQTPPPTQPAPSSSPTGAVPAPSQSDQVGPLLPITGPAVVPTIAAGVTVLGTGAALLFWSLRRRPDHESK